jgi:hypothetical protein
VRKVVFIDLSPSTGSLESQDKASPCAGMPTQMARCGQRF